MRIRTILATIALAGCLFWAPWRVAISTDGMSRAWGCIRYEPVWWGGDKESINLVLSKRSDWGMAFTLDSAQLAVECGIIMLLWFMWRKHESS